MDIGTRIALNNGTQIPRLGLGAYAVVGGEGTQAITWALQAGYRLIDTAAFYQNEAEVGQAIRQSGIPRQDIFVTTKLWNADQLNDNQLAAFEGSLEKLGLDYVDLYLLHWPVPGKFKASWRILEDLYATGRARAIGVSNFHANHLNELMQDAKITPALNQIELHPLLQQNDLVAACRKLGIAVQAWRPLGGKKGNLFAHPVLCAIGEKYGKTAAQVMLRWALQRDILVIPKSADKARLAANANLFDFELSADDMAAIAALDTHTRFGEDPDHIEDYEKLMAH